MRWWRAGFAAWATVTVIATLVAATGTAARTPGPAPAAFVRASASHGAIDPAGPGRGVRHPPVPAAAARTRAVAAPAPAVTHREERISTPAGPVVTDIVVADLRRSGVRATLLTGATVGERATVLTHAQRGHAVAAVNGDFFDLSRSNAPAGPSVRDGKLLTTAVPAGRRYAPAVPGSEPGDVLDVDAAGTPRIDRLTFTGSASGPSGRLPLRTLNAYAVPVGGIGLFTSDWNGDRNATLCGNDTDRTAPCAADRVEVVVRGGAVTALRLPGAGPIPAGEQILAGRDQGAAALRGLAVGDRVTVRKTYATTSGTQPRTAVGGSPILRGGAPVRGLNTTAREPRTAAGVTAAGKLILLTADGRESTSVGITLAEAAEQLRRAGAVAGVNLDGGGSSTMVYRGAVVNTPSADAYRLVPNALGVVAN